MFSTCSRMNIFMILLFHLPVMFASNIESLFHLQTLDILAGNSKGMQSFSSCLSCRSIKQCKLSLLEILLVNEIESVRPATPIFLLLMGEFSEYKTLADSHMEELDDPDMVVKEEKKVITRQEYVSQLQELKGEISQAWRADDRIKALKLSIKVSIFVTCFVTSSKFVHQANLLLNLCCIIKL